MRKKDPRLTIGTLMVLVLMTAVVLALVRYLRGDAGGDWRERVLVVHAVVIAVIIPMGVGLLYVAFAAGERDPARRNRKTGVVFALGICAWVFMLGSLAFCVLLMAFEA